MLPSSVPILFISFNNDDDKCSCCGSKYTVTPLYGQKYCENCLFEYIKEITNDDNIFMNTTFKDIINKYLDVHMNIKNKKFNMHKIRNFIFTQEEFSKIVYF